MAKAKNAQPATPAEVREWAASAQGRKKLGDLEVQPRGRLSAAVREAYTAATGREIAGPNS